MILTNTFSREKPAIKLEGSLTINSVAAAKQKIVAALAGMKAVQLDLSAVQECDAAGVQLILMTRSDARARGLTFSAGDQSNTFRAAAERIGVPVEIFEPSKQRSS